MADKPRLVLTGMAFPAYEDMSKGLQVWDTSYLGTYCFLVVDGRCYAMRVQSRTESEAHRGEA